MIKGVIPWIRRAESALIFIETSILVFHHQGRQGRTKIPPPALAKCDRLPPKNGFNASIPFQNLLSVKNAYLMPAQLPDAESGR